MECKSLITLWPQSSPGKRYATALKYYACTQFKLRCRAAKFVDDDIIQCRTAQSSFLTDSVSRMLNLAAQTALCECAHVLLGQKDKQPPGQKEILQNCYSLKLTILYVFQELGSSKVPELSTEKFSPVWSRTRISSTCGNPEESSFLNTVTLSHLRVLPLEHTHGIFDLVRHKVCSGLAVHKQKHYNSILINACCISTVKYCCRSSVLPSTWK